MCSTSLFRVFSAVSMMIIVAVETAIAATATIDQVGDDRYLRLTVFGGELSIYGPFEERPSEGVAYYAYEEARTLAPGIELSPRLIGFVKYRDSPPPNFTDAYILCASVSVGDGSIRAFRWVSKYDVAGLLTVIVLTDSRDYVSIGGGDRTAVFLRDALTTYSADKAEQASLGQPTIDEVVSNCILK